MKFARILALIIFSFLCLFLTSSSAQEEAVKPKDTGAKNDDAQGTALVVKKFIQELSKGDTETRLNAAKQLGKLGPKATEALDVLIRRRLDGVGVYRNRFTEAIGKIIPDYSAKFKVLQSGSRRTQVYILNHLDVPTGNQQQVDKLLTLLIEFRRGKDWSLSFEANWFLVKMGRQAVPALIATLKDRDRTQIIAIVETLTELLTKVDKTTKSSILKNLKGCLRDTNLGIRFEAAKAIWRLPNQFELVMPVFIDLICDFSGRKFNYEIVRIFRKAGLRVVPLLLAALEDARKSDKSRLIAALTWFAQKAKGKIGEKIVSALIEVAKVGKAREIEAICIAFGNLGEQGKRGIPALKANMKSDQVIVRAEAGFALWKLGGDPKLGIPANLTLLKVQKRRRRAAFILGRLGPKCKSENSQAAVHGLISIVKDEDREVRKTAVLALTQFGVRAKAAIVPILEFGENREMAAALKKLGLDVDSILLVIDHMDVKVQLNALSLLADTKWTKPGDFSKSIAALSTAIADEKLEVSIRALNCLERLGPRAAAALPNIQKALEFRDHKIHFEAAKTYFRVSGTATKSIEVLVSCLNIRQPATCIETLKLLTEIGPKGNTETNDKVIAGLLKLLEHKNLGVRRAALHSIGVWGPAGTQATIGTVIARLIKLFNDKDLGEIAISKVGSFGSNALVALGPLLKLKSSETILRVCEKIQPDIGILEKLSVDSNPNARAYVGRQLNSRSWTNSKDLSRVLRLFAKFAVDTSPECQDLAFEGLYDLAPSLPKFQPGIEEIVSGLALNLNHKDSRTLVLSLYLIALIGPKCEQKTVDKLITTILKQFKARNEASASVSMNTLGLLGREASKEKLDRVIDLFKTQVQSLTGGRLYKVLESIEPLGPKALGAIVPIIKCKSSNRVTVLRKILPNQKAVLKLHGHQNPRVRAYILERLITDAKLGSSDMKPVLEALSKSTEDKDLAVRELALMSFAKLGKGAESALPLLKRKVRVERGACKFSAAYSYWEIGGAEEFATTAILSTLKGKELELRKKSIIALGHIGAKAKKKCADLILRALIDSLKDKSLRSKTLEALETLGKKAEGAVVPLSQFEFSEVDWVLLSILPNASTMIKWLGHKTDKVRELTLRSLNFIAYKSKLTPALLKELTKLVQDKSSTQRKLSIIALATIANPNGLDVIGALLQGMNDKDGDIRATTAECLGSKGKKAIKAIPALKKALKDPVLEVRENAQSALDSIRGK